MQHEKVMDADQAAVLGRVVEIAEGVQSLGAALEAMRDANMVTAKPHAERFGLQVYRVVAQIGAELAAIRADLAALGSCCGAESCSNKKGGA